MPLGINFFHPSGIRAGLKATYVDQEGEFGNSRSGVVSGEDEFVVVDASVSYRLPRRMGIITVEGKNLFDQEIRFEGVDFRTSRIVNTPPFTNRAAFARFSLAF